MDETFIEHEGKNTNTLSKSSSLSEHDMITELLYEKQYQLDELQDNEKDEQMQRPTKRDREDENGEWKLIQNKEKKYKTGIEGGNIQIYISSNERMPKQFTLARLFKNEGIANIEKVRYINPFKIRVDMACDNNVERLEKCKDFNDRGWRIQRAMEVNLCYGVIRDIDLDIEEEAIADSISCPEPGILVSANRLMCRNPDGVGWKPSESIRLCFKGSFRPAYVYIHRLRIKVDPYVYPVTQCSRCWKLGHTFKRCSSTKVVCPKCSNNHNNCDTSLYKCINCGGQHMALFRSCPAYQKERRLRELMAEFNCTYRRALTLYISPTSSQHNEENTQPQRKSKPSGKSYAEAASNTLAQEPYFEVVKTKPTVNKDSIKKSTLSTPKKQRQSQADDPFTFEHIHHFNVDPPDSPDPKEEDEKKKKDVTFSELLRRLREILFLRKDSFQIKMQSIIKTCIEWVILVVVENISDWPILKPLVDFFIRYNG